MALESQIGRPIILNAHEVFDDVAFTPIGDGVLAAATGFSVRAAAFAYLQMHNPVAEAVEKAVVGGALVFDAGVAEAHVVKKFTFEVLEEHRGAFLPHEIHVLIGVDVVAWESVRMAQVLII